MYMSLMLKLPGGCSLVLRTKGLVSKTSILLSLGRHDSKKGSLTGMTKRGAGNRLSSPSVLFFSEMIGTWLFRVEGGEGMCVCEEGGITPKRDGEKLAKLPPTSLGLSLSPYRCPIRSPQCHLHRQ